MDDIEILKNFRNLLSKNKQSEKSPVQTEEKLIDPSKNPNENTISSNSKNDKILDQIPKGRPSVLNLLQKFDKKASLTENKMENNSALKIIENHQTNKEIINLQNNEITTPTYNETRGSVLINKERGSILHKMNIKDLINNEENDLTNKVIETKENAHIEECKQPVRTINRKRLEFLKGENKSEQINEKTIQNNDEKKDMNEINSIETSEKESTILKTQESASEDYGDNKAESKTNCENQNIDIKKDNEVSLKKNPSSRSINSKIRRQKLKKATKKSNDKNKVINEIEQNNQTPSLQIDNDNEKHLEKLEESEKRNSAFDIIRSHRPSVTELIKLNEKRVLESSLKKRLCTPPKKPSQGEVKEEIIINPVVTRIILNEEEKINNRYIHTAAENFTDNLKEIKNFMKILKQGKEEIENNEFKPNNSERRSSDNIIKKIEQDELQNIKELINYYEDKVDLKKKSKKDFIWRYKKRHTVTVPRVRRMRELKVSVIKEEEEEDFSRRSSTQSFYLVDQREINQEENCIERASNSSSSLEDLSNLSDKFVEDETLSKDNFNEEMNINRKEDQVAVLTQSNENNEHTSNNRIEALLEEENLEIRETDNNFKKETKHVVEIIDNEEIVQKDAIDLDLNKVIDINDESKLNIKDDSSSSSKKNIDLVKSEDDDININSKNNKNPNHNQQEDQNDIPKNLDEPDVNTNNFSNSPEIKDCLANSDLKSKINDGFEITSETCPVIIIAAKPKEKMSRIDLINSQLQINLVNDIMISSLDKKKEIFLTIESYSVTKPDNVMVIQEDFKDKEEYVENSKKHNKKSLLIEDSSYYETPAISDDEDLKHNEINKQNTINFDKAKYTNKNSFDLNIGDINPSQKSNSYINNEINTIENNNNLNNNEADNSNPSNDETKYQKNIINRLDSICVAQYNINPNFPFDPLFFDVLCINCYECVKYIEVDKHSDLCVIRPDEEFYDMYRKSNQGEEDVNSKIYKLYLNIKRKEDEIKKLRDNELISIFQQLIEYVYDIFLNNNSIEELDNSIQKLNLLISSKLTNITSNQKFSLLIYAKRFSQLVYLKLKDIEQALIIAKNNFEKEDLNESLFSESEDKNEEEEEEKKFENLKLELVHLERQTMKSKIELEAWKKEAKNLEKMLKKPSNNAEALSDIISDIVSYKSDDLDRMTNITGQTDNEQDVGNMRDINEVLAIKTEEDMKKYFFSIGLNIKFKYADKIKENWSIDSIYEKAKKNCIPVYEWQRYIHKELNIN